MKEIRLFIENTSAPYVNKIISVSYTHLDVYKRQIRDN